MAGETEGTVLTNDAGDGGSVLGNAWHAGIENADVRAVAEKFETQEALLEALGVQAPAGEEEDGEGEDKDKDKDRGKGDAGAPEAYEDFKVSEGMEANAEAMTKFQGVAKELDLSQEQAQKLVDFQAEFMQEMTNAQVKTWEKMRSDWLKEAKADDEVGGQNFDDKLELAKKGLSEFGDAKLIEVLETFGLGNHVAMISAWARVGEAIGEDKIVTSDRSGQQGKTLAERIFSTQPKA